MWSNPADDPSRLIWQLQRRLLRRIDIYKAGGIHPKVMRSPGDQYDDKVPHVMKALGYMHIAWTDAAKD